MRKTALYNIVSLLALLHTSASKGQNVIDHAYLKCQYQYTYQKDTLAGKTGDDLLVLQIGREVSKCFSYYSAQVDSISALPNSYEVIHRIIKQAFTTGTDFPHKRMKTYIYKNYPKGEMTVTDGVSLQYFLYEDSLDVQQWEIKDSVRQVMGYEVQMAECDFRGRHWVAWFSEEIPVGDGPWKFGGLPGLIMEAYDTQQQHHFVINGLQRVDREPIIFTQNYVGSMKYERTTRKKFLLLYRRYLSDVNGYTYLETGIDLGQDGKQKALGYDLLERDYR